MYRLSTEFGDINNGISDDSVLYFQLYIIHSKHHIVISHLYNEKAVLNPVNILLQFIFLAKKVNDLFVV